MTISEWFATHEWHKENSRREDFEAIWMSLRMEFVSEQLIASVLDRTIEAMRDEYT